LFTRNSRAGNWRHVASRPKRPLKSIVLDPGMKDLLLDDAKDFLESEDWYAERGIPFRRGYLLVRIRSSPAILSAFEFRFCSTAHRDRVKRP
jgi:hypothetical protein